MNWLRPDIEPGSGVWQPIALPLNAYRRMGAAHGAIAPVATSADPIRWGFLGRRRKTRLRYGTITQPDTGMPNLTIKNLPQAVYERLKWSAQESRRSLNSEVIHRLESSVGSAAADPEALLAQVRALRLRTPLPHLTDDVLREARERGRE